MKAAEQGRGWSGRRSWRVIAATLAVIAACGACGCGGGAPKPRIGAAAYAGPALSVESWGRYHAVVMEAPTPGFALTLDRTEEERYFRQAFVTVRQPNPGYIYPQVVVKQTLLTPVETRLPLRVYARWLAFDDKATDGEYGLAAERASSPPGPMQAIPADAAATPAPGTPAADGAGPAGAGAGGNPEKP